SPEGVSMRITIQIEVDPATLATFASATATTETPQRPIPSTTPYSSVSTSPRDGSLGPIAVNGGPVPSHKRLGGTSDFAPWPLGDTSSRSVALPRDAALRDGGAAKGARTEPSFGGGLKSLHTHPGKENDER